MPITLGCPTCGKRFRARDESAGKKVKCPYCQAPVQVPTSEEAGASAAPAAASPPDSGMMPPVSPRPTSPPPSPSPQGVAPAQEWGVATPAPAAAPPPSGERTFPVREPEPPQPKRPPEQPAKERPEPEKPAAKTNSKTKSPDQVLASSWRQVRRGMFWIQFGIFWFFILGLVGIGKLSYERYVGPLPQGDGADWVSIEGFLNSNEKDAIPLRKEEMVNLLGYGVPVLLGSLFMIFGRLIVSSGPRMSGSRGIFGLSCLAFLLAFIAYAAFKLFKFADLYKVEAEYLIEAVIILVPLAEILCLVGITACGLALRRPGVARCVGILVFLSALAYAGYSLGWSFYLTDVRPKDLDPGSLEMEKFTAIAVATLLITWTYWAACRGVRAGARDFIESVRNRAEREEDAREQ